MYACSTNSVVFAPFFVSNSEKKDVFPKILKVDRGIKFIIAGSNMPPEVFELASEHIVIAGELSDPELENLYKQCRVAVVPLRYGAGIKGKVLEAMQKQIPVVTTDVGAEGMPSPLDYLKVSSGSKEFADNVLELFGDKKIWRLQVEKGVSCLNRYFSKQQAKEILGMDIELSGNSEQELQKK